eukprot:CAMPEP_0117047090 /NCGR_PEP_ID=MMETSP0472-20121206/32559_1 /TAXON_ID=693140 ORGANISM="Tiarina fusus, Strain LIS" /NCGR_SAMPLE_ID=MMETSP0472 /ASSEMBLY_ACC=CAM_ASM_000603 /LENGTH=406 /DNA_ID=CAMNT_0004759689 /DNA_START=100 /DNA_END=1320 /DNA_ORIENTATION=-
MTRDRTTEANKARNIVSSASEESDDESQDSGKKARHTIAKRRSRTSSRRSSIASIPHHEKHFVEHNYHDHLHDPIEPEAIAIQEATELEASKKRRGHRGGVAVPFPEKLHDMLSKMDEEGNTNIVAWQPHGRCFTVHKPKEFVEEIMPRHFKQTKLTSFQRQLNLYGFSRLTAGPDRGGYYHELFIRGRMDLCKRMARTRVKGNGSKAASSPSTEPNFYAMPPCFEGGSCGQASSLEGTTAQKEKSGDGTMMITSGGDDAMASVRIKQHGSDDMMPFDTTMNAALCSRTATGSTAATVHGDEDICTPPVSPAMKPTKTYSTCPPISLPFSAGSLPIVSPFEPKTLISAPSSPQLLASLSIPEEQCLSSTVDEILEDIHSGDQMFFEGLPFHYLETKDVEDSLLVGP